MIMRKVMSLALAIGMLGAAFLALALPVSAGDLNVEISTTNGSGKAQELFFDYDPIYFKVEYKIGTTVAGAPIDVRMRDMGGNTVGRIQLDNGPTPGPYGHYIWPGSDPTYGSLTVWTNQTGVRAGFYDSCWVVEDVYFETDGNGINDDMIPGNTYYLEATQHNTSLVVYTAPVRIISEGIAITPDQGTYAPGQKVNINVTEDLNDKINVTVIKTSAVNWNESVVNWTELALTEFSWTTDWTIPSNLLEGGYWIIVNISVTGQPIYDWTMIQIGYFDLTASTNKPIYLPGEQATVSWLGRSVLDNSVADVELDWDMWYFDSVSGKETWIKAAALQSDSPFTITLPSNANIYNDIGVNASLKRGDNSSNFNSSTNMPSLKIKLGALEAMVSTDAATYGPGDVVILMTGARVSDGVTTAPEENASVKYALYDADGKLTTVNISATTTDASGQAVIAFTIPTDMKAAAGYMIVATVSKLGQTDIASDEFDVSSAVTVTVQTDKATYTAGESIVATLSVLRNGVQVIPDSIEYWLEFASGIQTNHLILVNSNATVLTISVPTGQQGNAMVRVDVTIGDDPIISASAGLQVVPLIITIGASEVTFSPGDTVDFTVLAAGESSGFTLRYDIWEADKSPVKNGALTLADNSATFSLDIPEGNPSWAYDVRVIANNNAGVIAEADMRIMLVANYTVEMKIVTAPASASGAYAPGQELTISFEITKMRSELPNITVIQAQVILANMFGANVTFGENMPFTTMSGELTIVLPKDLNSNWYTIILATSLGVDSELITVSSNGGTWASNIGGNMSMTDMMLAIMMVVVILMLLWQMIKGRAAAAGAGAASKPAEPKAKEESYAPKATVTCASCSSPIEVATSKRPIEVMCPKCGKSQMVN